MAIRLVDKHTDLEVTDCCTCGVDFAAPKRILDERRRNGGSFYCPNGHSMVFTETEVDRLRKQKKQLDAQLTSTQDQLIATRDDRDRVERSNVALRGVVTRERNRVGRGVCPCCNRSFANLGRHMAGQHPQYAAEEPTS